MSRMSDMVRDNTKQQKQQRSFSEWGRCAAHGCPMVATVKTASELCQYHHGQNMGQGGETWNAITEAIKENKGLVKKYTDMVYKPSCDWNIAAMRGWETLPMGEFEPATMYLNRFYKWVHEQINNRATEILQ